MAITSIQLPLWVINAPRISFFLTGCYSNCLFYNIHFLTNFLPMSIYKLNWVIFTSSHMFLSLTECLLWQLDPPSSTEPISHFQPNTSLAHPFASTNMCHSVTLAYCSEFATYTFTSAHPQISTLESKRFIWYQRIQCHCCSNVQFHIWLALVGEW